MDGMNIIVVEKSSVMVGEYILAELVNRKVKFKVIIPIG